MPSWHPLKRTVDSARKPCAAGIRVRTAAHKAQQELVSEQKRVQKQAAVLDEPHGEPEQARRLVTVVKQ